MDPIAKFDSSLSFVEYAVSEDRRSVKTFRETNTQMTENLENSTRPAIAMRTEPN